MEDEDIDVEENINEDEEIKEDLKESIKTILDDIPGMNYTNGEQIIRRALNANELIEGHINNSLMMDKKNAKDFNAIKNRKSVKKMINEEEICPLELIKTLRDSKHHLREAFEWQRVSLEMAKDLNRKTMNILSSIKALDIQKAVTENFKNVQQEWFNLVKDLTNNKFIAVDSEINKIKDKIYELKELAFRQDKEVIPHTFKKPEKIEDEFVEEDIVEQPVKKGKIINNNVSTNNIVDDNLLQDEASPDLTCEKCGKAFSHMQMKKVHEQICKSEGK